MVFLLPPWSSCCSRGLEHAASFASLLPSLLSFMVGAAFRITLRRRPRPAGAAAPPAAPPAAPWPGGGETSCFHVLAAFLTEYDAVLS
eukprot:scaffold70455_cov19-Tisochrysis_lutea.AAC.1